MEKYEIDTFHVQRVQCVSKKNNLKRSVIPRKIYIEHNVEIYDEIHFYRHLSFILEISRNLSSYVSLRYE